MKVESFKIAGWEDEELGLFIDENEDWILVKHIPIDFVIDGYKVYRKEYVERLYAEDKILIEKVLTLKGIKEDKPEGFEFAGTLDLLKWSEKKYGFFEFQIGDQDELFYGKINRVKEQNLIIDSIRSDGELDVEFDYEFPIEEIRVVTFETDYFNSVKLIWEDRQYFSGESGPTL